ncbi:hypothetical protein [Pseudonocardia charpentierae]|uniref:Uncharacterized protein n=1 Tax=Pseudonocardia charpentierae TaxID=3075545 RepID=A0ABU2NM68_9PSEU|nr:hypothetical protein [Pseudonocardia sp. DSM 45834]MDT0353739.1 hypothetical protein [Pseudonocardia sp. DSM 45834]
MNECYRLAGELGFEVSNNDFVDYSYDSAPLDYLDAASRLAAVGKVLCEATADDELIHTEYSRSSLSTDLARLIVHFEALGQVKENRFRIIGTVFLRNVLFVLPGYGMRRIQTATLDPLWHQDTSCSLSDFGRQLVKSAEQLASAPSRVGMPVHLALIREIEGLAEECDADHPRTIEEQVLRLQDVITDFTVPAEYRRNLRFHSAGYAVFALAAIGVAALTPWQGLADESYIRNGVLAVTPSLFFLLVANSTFCAHIAFLAGHFLNDYTVATMKTYAKATTVTLAISTLVLGAGLNAGGDASLGVPAGLAVYVLTLLSSLSADNLAHHAEARLKVLTTPG